MVESSVPFLRVRRRRRRRGRRRRRRRRRRKRRRRRVKKKDRWFWNTEYSVYITILIKQRTTDLILGVQVASLLTQQLNNVQVVPPGGKMK